MPVKSQGFGGLFFGGLFRPFAWYAFMRYIIGSDFSKQAKNRQHKRQAKSIQQVITNNLQEYYRIITDEISTTRYSM